MGTVFDQPVRTHHQVNAIDHVAPMAKKLDSIATDTGLDLDQIIKIYEISCYNARTRAMVDNGDSFDEQIAGIAKLIQELNNILDVKL